MNLKRYFPQYPFSMEELYKIKRNQLIEQERQRCIILNETEPYGAYNASDELRCPVMFDTVSCLPSMPANSVWVIDCPQLYFGVTSNKSASRVCSETGEWAPKTNYDECLRGSTMMVAIDINTNNTNYSQLLLSAISTMSMTGYTISLCTLVFAFLIMLCIRKLHCARNRLHMHLFASFILKAGITLLQAFLFADGVALSSDTKLLNGEKYYVDGLSVTCKLLMSFFNFFVSANYSWILMEGLYLHNLIFRSMFADSNKNISQYIVLGWGLPLLMTCAWVTARLMIDDTLCWNTHDTNVFLFFVRIPTGISILLNLILFIRIVVVIYSKLQAPNQEEARSVKKWARSTLVLAPLFGIHYALLLVLSSAININPTIEIIWLFADQLFASFQGFVVAVLYCFLNSEVRTELKPRLHAPLVFIASNVILKNFFPCRKRYLRSARGRTSVSTTMSCSSLYNNGINLRNSRTGSRGDFKASHKNVRNKDHICQSNGRAMPDDDQICQIHRTSNQFNGFIPQNEAFARLSKDFGSEALPMMPINQDMSRV